jgi:hypothetical protein
MDIGLYVSCTELHRQAYRAQIPIQMYNHLTKEHKTRIKYAFDRRERSYTTEPYTFDPNFRIEYPSLHSLTYDAILNYTTNPTLSDLKIPQAPPNVLPPITNSLYIDVEDKTRTFEDLLKQYVLPLDGIEPKRLTPAEYLAYLKNKNKLASACIKKLDKEITTLVTTLPVEELQPIQQSIQPYYTILENKQPRNELLTLNDFHTESFDAARLILRMFPQKVLVEEED